MEHLLKVRKKNFEPILNGDLTFVIRKVDNIYSVGDRLVLFEVDGQKETGRSLVVLIKFVMHSEDSEGIKDDYCVLSVKRSGKNTRTNAGNHPNSAEEAIEYAAKIGKSEACAIRFFDYYSMSGWKMKSGLPLSDWHAALRNWKDYSANQRSPEDRSVEQQLELLLPMLLKKTASLAKQKEKLVFTIRSSAPCSSSTASTALIITSTSSKYMKWSRNTSPARNSAQDARRCAPRTPTARERSRCPPSKSSPQYSKRKKRKIMFHTTKKNLY